MVTIVDLDIGNLESVAGAFRRIGVETVIAATPREAEGARILVLPGVGAFDRAMANLDAKGFRAFIGTCVSERRSALIGICLGMQLLADRSHEHRVTEGLGLIRGEVTRLDPRSSGDRVPNIGWMPVKTRGSSAVFSNAFDGESFYHVHSFHLVCSDPTDIAATIDFGGQQVVTAIERKNVFGMQFHPEKSQDAGLNLLCALLTHIDRSLELEP